MLLVTGITGHTGRYFLQELIDNKYQGKIRCIVRKTSNTSMLDNSNLNIEKVIGDLSDEKFINKSMKDITLVIHIVNIRYSLGIIKAAINNNVNRAIFIHTTGIYSKFRIASEEYNIIENEINNIVDKNNINLTILRPTMIYGDACDKNMSKFIKMIDKLRVFPVINNGTSLIQPVNARDLGKAYYNIMMLSLQKTKSEYIVSGDKPIKMIEAFKLISNVLNKKTMFISFPVSFGVFLARILKILTFGKIDYVERVQRMSEDRSFSHVDATEDFNYKPESFESGIAREVRQYLKR